jgi:hypothetical protein
MQALDQALHAGDRQLQRTWTQLPETTPAEPTPALSEEP